MKKIAAVLTVAMLAGSVPAFAQPQGMEHPAGDGHHKRPRLEMLDTDGNGMVSKDEFMAMHLKRFAAIDANGDGNISKEEIEAYRVAKKAEREKMKGEGKETPPPMPEEE